MATFLKFTFDRTGGREIMRKKIRKLCCMGLAMAVLLGVLSPAASAAGAEIAAGLASLSITGVPAPQNNAGTGIPYLDENGQQASCDTYTEIGSGMLTWGTAGQSTWYVASSTQTLSGRVTVNGDVHLILVNNANLTVSGGIRVASGSSLTIYAQSAGDTMGALIANASSAGNAGIGGNVGDSNGAITINGGEITASGADASGRSGGGAGIGSGDRARAEGTITINGGDVTATGGTGEHGAGAGIGGGGNSSAAKEIVITGGVIYAEAGANGAAGIGGGGHDGLLEKIVITGGTITAKGTYRNGSAGNGKANAIGGGSGGYAADPSDFSNCMITDAQAKLTSIYGDKDNSGLAVLDKNYTIETGATLEIPKGTTLVIESGVTLTNNGTFIHNGGLDNRGTVTGSGTAVHNLSSGTAVNADEHEGKCGCGETVRMAHGFGNYRDNGDGTHTEYCSICQYEKATAAHSYNTWTENDAFMQNCGTCGMQRTITVGSVSGKVQFDTSGPDIKADLTLQAEASADAEGMSWQWQKMETKTALSIAPSESHDDGYYQSYTYRDVPEGGTIAFRYQASGPCSFRYYLMGPDRFMEEIQVDEAMSGYETVVIPELPAGTYTLEISPMQTDMLTLDTQPTQVSYEAYADINGATKAAYTVPDFESGAQYRVQIRLGNETLVREYRSPERLAITGVAAQDAQYDGSAHTGYTGTAAAAGYTGEIAVTYQMKSGENYRNIPSAPVDPGQYRVLFTIDSQDGASYGIEALEFTITAQDTPADGSGADGNGGTSSGEGVVQTGDGRNLFFWVALMCTSAAGLAGAGFAYKRSKKRA